MKGMPAAVLTRSPSLSPQPNLLPQRRPTRPR